MVVGANQHRRAPPTRSMIHRAEDHRAQSDAAYAGYRWQQLPQEWGRLGRLWPGEDGHDRKREA